MDFVYTRDIARANILAAGSDVDEGVYNIASGTETSLLELAEALLRAMDSDLARRARPRARRQRRRPAASPTRAAAQRDLGFSATIGLEEGLRELVDWWRAAARRDRGRAGRAR